MYTFLLYVKIYVFCEPSEPKILNLSYKFYIYIYKFRTVGSLGLGNNDNNILDPRRWDLIVCLEKSLRNYHNSPRNNPAERIIYLVRSEEGFSCVEFVIIQFPAVSVVA